MPTPTFDIELSHAGIVAGIDEAGRGPWGRAGGGRGGDSR
jgi:hypothetical protein